MTDTHLALTKSDSGFWKIEEDEKKNEHKFLNLASMIMIRLHNEEWWTEGGMFPGISSIHTYIHTLSTYRYLGIHTKLLQVSFSHFLLPITLLEIIIPQFLILGLNWEEKTQMFFLDM